MARKKTSFSDSFLKNIKSTDICQEIIEHRGLGIWVQKMGKRIVGKPTVTYTSPKTKKRKDLAIRRYVEEASGNDSLNERWIRARQRQE